MGDTAPSLLLVVGVQIVLTVAVGWVAIQFAVRRHRSLGEGREEARFETLHLASQTLPHLRRGLSEQTAAATAQLIFDYTQAAGVAIVDGNTIAAFVGAAIEHHQPGQSCKTALSREV